MRFKINYGGKPTYDPKDFSRGKFECKAVFRTRKGLPVVVSHNTDPACELTSRIVHAIIKNTSRVRF